MFQALLLWMPLEGSMCSHFIFNLTHAHARILTLHSSRFSHLMAVVAVQSIFLTVLKYLPNDALNPFTACLLKGQHMFKTYLRLIVPLIMNHKLPLQTSCRPLYVFPGGQGNLEARDVLNSQGTSGPFTPIITVKVQESWYTEVQNYFLETQYLLGE